MPLTDRDSALSTAHVTFQPRIADALGLPTGASANKSIAGMPGAIWCSTAFTDPYRALQPEIRKQHNHVVSFVVVEPTTVDCPTSAGRQPPSRDLPPCVVSIHTEFRDIAQAHSSPS
jgi:hypothetical protein